MYREGPPYQRRGSLQLWQFLVTLLDDPANAHFIAWTGRGMEFKLIEPEEVSIGCWTRMIFNLLMVMMFTLVQFSIEAVTILNMLFSFRSGLVNGLSGALPIIQRSVYNSQTGRVHHCKIYYKSIRITSTKTGEGSHKDLNGACFSPWKVVYKCCFSDKTCFGVSPYLPQPIYGATEYLCDALVIYYRMQLPQYIFQMALT